MKLIVLLICVESLLVGSLHAQGNNYESPSIDDTQSDSEIVDQALEYATNSMKQSDPKSSTTGPPTDKNHHGYHRYCKFTEATQEIGYYSNKLIIAYEALTQQTEMSPPTAWNLLSSADSGQPETCKEKYVECDQSQKYRTIDGTCNNLAYPLWGSAIQPFSRIFKPEYQDGFNSPRGGLSNTELPNPRLVSSTVHHDFINPDPSITNMIPQIGQFLDHDLTLTPEPDLPCCGEAKDNVDCWPIEIFPNDTFYSNLPIPQTCMPFSRSTPFCFLKTKGIREQFNINTGFMDASQVYGSDPVRAKQLREFEGGRLVENVQHADMLPSVDQVRESRGEDITFMGFFIGGDERVNEMPALTVMHTLMLREHNRIAGEIHYLRPHWTDEKVFEETRRLLIAQWQNIIYGEYLPIILGKNTVNRYKLKVTTQHSKYDEKRDATILTEFATAAYRFGHTLVNGLVRLQVGLQQVGSYLVRFNFFDPTQILQNNGEGYNYILGGLMTQNSQTFDPFVTEDLGNFVLKKKEDDFGADLIARNLQRGRDHGVRGYSAYREDCGLTPLQSTWGPPPEGIVPSAWEALSKLYKKPTDIDLFTGGLIEYPLSGAVSGPTFNCLKARQFARLKFGDRFFFTHEGEAGSFSKKQLKALRATNLGDLICLNSKVSMTTKNVFKIPGSDNPWIPCNGTREYLNIEEFL